MVQNVNPVLKALTNSFIGAGMGANTDSFGMSSFDTSSDKLVGESSIFGAEIFKDFVTTHRQLDLRDHHQNQRRKAEAKRTGIQTLSTPASANVLMLFVISSGVWTYVVIPSQSAPPRGAI